MPAITTTDLDNAKTDVDHIAAIATSLEDTATDRLGHVKQTMTGAIGSIAAITNRGAWATATVYSLKDMVLSAGTWYICVVAHTSGATFAADSATKWRIYQGVAAVDLADSADTAKGATLVGYLGGTLRAYLNQFVTSAGASIIGWIQSGVGAATRLVQDKLRDTVSVKDFGAVGDGVADDSAAFNAAVTALGYGGRLLVPKGTYKLNSAWNIPAAAGSLSGLSIVGEGKGTLIQPGAAMTSLINVTGKSVSISGLTLNNASSFATNGILFTNSSLDASLSAEVFGNEIIGFINGISATGQNYNIHHNFLQNNTTHINFTNDGRNTSIDNNYFLGGAIGIRLTKAASGQQAEGVRIVNNTILVTVGGGAGIEIDAGLEIYIGFNIIDQTGPGSPGIYIPVAGTDAVNRVKITGNWIAGGLNSYSFFASGNNSNLDFIDNTFACTNSLAVLAGLSLTATQRAKIIGNNFLLSGGGIDFSTTGTSSITLLDNTATAGTPIDNVLAATAFTGIVDTGAIGQITFPATQNPSAGANTLDDYEEGTWTPVITASSGIFTTVSATGTYTKIGRLVVIYLTVSITTNGTAAGAILASLPLAASVAGQGHGRENGVSGKQLQAILSGANASMTNYDNTYPGANGASIQLSGTYFSA